MSRRRASWRRLRTLFVKSSLKAVTLALVCSFLTASCVQDPSVTSNSSTVADADDTNAESVSPTTNQSPGSVSTGDDDRNPYLDLDLDGYPPIDGDCNDDDPNVSPDASEVCGDGIDQDCSGEDLDCGDADQDRDGVTPNEGDCNDQEVGQAPDRLETCGDGIDQDCDGRDLPCDEVDSDGDGVSPAQGDCNDMSSRIRPGRPDICGNGIDEDCDGDDALCEDNSDDDGDGVINSDDNCPDDFDPSQADTDLDGLGNVCDNCPEVMNEDQTDSDGDGVGDRCDSEADTDGDGVSAVDGDCSPADGSVFPGAEEVCGNGSDDNCDGFIDDGCEGIDLRTGLVFFNASDSLLGYNATGADTSPQIEVTLDAFSIEIHEVTNRQYAACMDAQRCTPPANTDALLDPNKSNFPVVWVNQVQADMYCAWTGGRLPTEAEWERVARGDEPLVPARRYPWGSEIPAACERGHLGTCARPGPSPVMSFEGDITENGVFDLGGNVHEHVRGWYGETYYADAPSRNPMGPLQPDNLERVPRRGGSFGSAPEVSTLFFRGAADDFYIRRNYAQPDLGFRCLRPEPAPQSR